MSEERHYSAFISYRHVPRDIEVARHIQQKLEHFKAPKQIAEKYGISGFDRLFRDQEELEIGADLSAKIQYALDHSDYLIVICSPEYSESKWCQLEVESFLQKHDHDHVFCVLSSGEPPEIFPKILCDHAEPLGCDYRGDFKEADRIELPRLESAMIGCSYDELVMRQERYRRKRMRTILASVFAAASIVISYLLYSNAIIRKNYALSQINGSRLLARESLNYLSQSDRYEALSSALEALDGDRPETDDAIYALSKAANAYQTPYHYSESWRVDQVSDISDMIVSGDGRYIICQGSDSIFHTIDILTHEEKASFQIGSDVLSFEEGKKGQLIAYAQGSLRCIDYLNGETLFETPMKYQSIGLSRTSHSGKLIATADSFAMQICDDQGAPYLSLPLPEDQDGYIIDFRWSEDDRYLAVKLRCSDRRYRIGIFEMETSLFVSLSEEKTEILSFDFLSDGRFYILSDDNGNRSYRDADSCEQYQGIYDLEIYDPLKRVFAKRIEENGIPGNSCLVQDGGILSLIISDRLYRYDEDFDEIGQYSLPDSIVSVLYHSQDYMNVLCADGYNGTIFYKEGSSSFVRTFPKDADQILVAKGGDILSDIYVLRKDGDLHIYEGSYDEELQILSDSGFDHPESGLLNGDSLFVKTQNGLLQYPLSGNETVRRIPLENGHAYHLLKADADRVFILKADAKTGKLSIAVYSAEDASLISEISTSLYNIYLRAGILSYPLDRAESVFLDAFYEGFSSMCLNDHLLYLHDETDSGRISVIDLDTYEVSSVDTGRQLLMNGLASPILLSGDGKKLLTYSDEEVLLIDLPAKEAIVLSRNDSTRALADIDDVLVYASSDHLNVSSLSGEPLYQIDHHDHDVVSFKAHEGRIYCIGDDHVLRIYGDGKLLRSVKLSFADPAFSEYSLFHYVFAGERLCLFNDTAMEVISLSSDSSMPLYFIEDSVLAFDTDDRKIFLYSYDPSKRDGLYYPALFREYDRASLLEKAKREVADFR